MTSQTTQNTKICNTCHLEKALEDFRQWRARCIVCDRAINKEKAKLRRQENPEQYREYQRKRYLEKRGWKLWRVIWAVVRDEWGKVCSTCKQYLPWESYTKESKSKDWHAYCCRECTSKRKAKYLATEKGKIMNRNYKIIHKDVSQRAMKKYYEKNKDKLLEYKKQYTLEQRKKWRQNYEKKFFTPWTYVMYWELRWEVCSSTGNVIRIRLLRTNKQVLTYKSKLRLCKKQEF